MKKSQRIYWDQRNDSYKGHNYSKTDEELFWKCYNKISNLCYLNNPSRILIVPNVAWRYCSDVQAKAYRQLDLNNIQRIFVFAPLLKSFSVGKCYLGTRDSVLNPILRISTDQKIFTELFSTKMFDDLSKIADEKEYTFESQLPFIATLLAKQPNKIRIVPIYVGELKFEDQKMFGAIFSRYMKDNANAFVFSTNFYSWGKCFNFTFRYPNDKTPVQTLNKLLIQGIEAIRPLDPEKYLTYCLFSPGKFQGQHLIGILMYAVQTIKNRENEKFNEMSQDKLKLATYTKFTLKFLEKGFSNLECSDEDNCFAFASGSVVLTQEKLIVDEPVSDAPLDKRV